MARKQVSLGQVIKMLIGLTISVICLYLVARQIELQDLKTAFVSFQWQFALFGLACLAMDYVLRVIRWAILLNATTDRRIGFKECWAPFMGSITLNNILPLRAGDVIRSVVFPRSMRIKIAAAASSVLVERIIDLLTIIIGLLVSFWLIQAVNAPEYLTRSAPWLAAFCLIGLIIIVFGSLLIDRILAWIAAKPVVTNSTGLTKLFGLVRSLVGQVVKMSRPTLMASALALSAIIWIAEAGLFYFIITGFGVELSFAAAFFIMTFATLATLIPSSPGYFGTFHLAAITGMGIVGLTSGLEASIAVILHFFLWGATSLVGAMALFTNPGLFSKSKDVETL